MTGNYMVGKRIDLCGDHFDDRNRRISASLAGTHCRISAALHG